MTDDSYDDRPLPFWLRMLLKAHQSGQPAPIIDHGGKPGISKAEIGMLLAGCSRIEDACFRLRYLGQENERHVVWAHLNDTAKKWAERRDFEKVHCADCLSRLVGLVVDEETINPHHHTEAFRARYMGVSRGVWKSRYDKPHKHLKGRIDKWSGAAVSNACGNLYGKAS